MSGAAVAAAAAAARRRREEEEEMAVYSERDLAEGWEFKIVRSAMGSFRRPEFLQRTLEEEGRSGWVLLEKFDNQRIRLKRPASARTGPGAGVDPYRSYVGTSPVAIAILVPICVLSAMAIVVAVILTLKHP